VSANLGAPVKPEVFSLPLEANALDSLATAIEYYFDGKKPTAWKYAIMLAGHAVELFLKLALARKDPSLIYEDKHGGWTVNYAMAIERLAEVGVELSDQERQDIKALRRSRNDLEHLEATISRAQVDNTLVRAMRFLDGFLPMIDIDIATVIPDRERFLEFKQSIQSAEEWLAKAEKLAEEKIPYREVKDGARFDRVFCPECYGETVTIGENMGVPICEQCHSEFPDWEYCDSCGTPIPEGIPKDDVGMCEACWDHRGNTGD